MSTNSYRNLNKPNRLLIPVILMMGFVPLIVHTYSYNANLSQFDWWPDSADSQTDFFFGWKMVALIVLGAVMAVILLYRHFGKKEKLRFDNAFYLLLLYGLFAGMAALFSGYKYWVAHGTYELFEPVWVVFTYMLACYYVYHCVEREEQVRLILRISGIGMAVVTMIGVFQYTGRDFFKTDLGKHLITDSAWWNQLDNLSFNMGEKTSYTTLYNPNFLSFYFGMLIALLAGLFIGAKKFWKRLAFAAAGILCGICIVGSGSMAGWMALVLGAVVLALVLLSRKKKTFYAGIVGFVVLATAALVFMHTTAAGQNIKNTVLGTYYYNDMFALQGVSTGTDSVELDIRGNVIALSYETGDDGSAQIVCRDADGNVIACTVTDETNQVSVPNDARFAELSLQPALIGDGVPGMCVTVQGRQWNFALTGDGYYYVNSAGKAVKYETAERADLFRADAMSFRGYIWNDTLPLLAKHILVGSGANTYMFEYPQDDYLRAYIYGNSYDVKAHCWYLQQWVETGLVGTLALLGFLGWYLVRSVRIYRRADRHNELYWTGFAVFSAVLVYAFAAIANDSNVCTAPVFWCMLGLGLALNRIIAEKEGLFAVKEEAPAAAEEIIEKEEPARETVTAKKTGSGKKQSRKQRKKQGK